MSIPTIITILQGLFSLAIGLYLTKKIRPHLRKLVLRLTPLKYRFSEEFFGLQNRINTTVLLLVAAGIMAFSYLLTGKVKKSAAHFSLFSTTSESEIYPVREEAVYSDFDPGMPLVEDTLPDNQVLPQAAELDQPLSETIFFLQLYAFQRLERAQVQQSYWSGRLSKKVKIVIVEESDAPYKVWAGPFASRSETKQFNQKYRLGGFIIKMPQ